MRNIISSLSLKMITPSHNVNLVLMYKRPHVHDISYNLHCSRFHYLHMASSRLVWPLVARYGYWWSGVRGLS